MEELPEGHRDLVVAVADTHVFVWYLFNQRKLSQTVRHWFTEVLESPNAKIGVSTISVVELTYMLDRKRISQDDFDLAISKLTSETSPFCAIPLGVEEARAIVAVSNMEIPDMPDRMIAATAVHLGVPLITADDWIRKSSIETMW